MNERICHLLYGCHIAPRIHVKKKERGQRQCTHYGGPHCHLCCHVVLAWHHCCHCPSSHCIVIVWHPHYVVLSLCGVIITQCLHRPSSPHCVVIVHCRRQTTNDESVVVPCSVATSPQWRHGTWDLYQEKEGGEGDALTMDGDNIVHRHR
jgi:hypothetical protein